MTAHDTSCKQNPTLAAILARDAGVRLNIELKLFPAHPEWTVPPEEMVERVIHEVDAAGAAARVTLQSFDWRAPRYARRIRPDLRVGWLTEDATIRAAPLWRGDPAAPAAIAAVPDAIAAEGGGHWAPFHTELTETLLAAAHARAIPVIPWTVNDAADMRRLTAWGVDGLISDWPDRAG